MNTVEQQIAGSMDVADDIERAIAKIAAVEVEPVWVIVDQYNSPVQLIDNQYRLMGTHETALKFPRRNLAVNKATYLSAAFTARMVGFNDEPAPSIEITAVSHDEYLQTCIAHYRRMLDQIVDRIAELDPTL